MQENARFASPTPTAVFLSGGGRTLENLLQHVSNGSLAIDIRLVISSSAKVRGVEIGRKAGIETRVVLKSRYGTDEAYRDAMFAPCREVGAELIIMAGFLKHALIPEDFAGRVINIHPSLIPAFSGEGMYGMHVHEAAIMRGVQFSGCTVHFVDNAYDHGPIILQQICPVPKDYSAADLAAAVFELECNTLPQAIRMIQSGK